MAQTAPRPDRVLNVGEGLPQSFVSDLVQDSAGFLWIGTHDGLARYDGRALKTFQHVPGRDGTLAHNDIINFCLDRRQRLWICYGEGSIDLLNVRTEAVTHLTGDPVFQPLARTWASGNAIVEDAAGTVWIRSLEGGLYRCDPDSRQLRYWTPQAAGIPADRILGAAPSGDGLVLVTDTSLVWYDSRTMRPVRSVPFSFAQPHLYNPKRPWKDLTPLIRRGTSELFLVDEERLIGYYPATGTFTVQPLPSIKLYIQPSLAQDATGTLYFGHNTHIYALPPDNRLQCWRYEDLPYHEAISLLVDRSGVLWTGGNTTGLRAYDLRLPRLEARPYRLGFATDVLQNVLGIPAPVARYVFPPHASYLFRWVGGARGDLWITSAGRRQETATIPVLQYRNGTWALKNWKFPGTEAHQTPLPLNALAFSRSGRLWGLDYALHPVRMDTAAGIARAYPPVPGAPPPSDRYDVNTLLLDGEDTCWITATHTGLLRHVIGSGTALRYRPTDGSELTCATQDPRQPAILWIGTLAGGLLRFDKRTGRYRAYTTADGLPNNTVYAALPDRLGRLWCSSNKGIFCFDPVGQTVRSFTAVDGLPGDEFNRFHFLQLPDGRMVFGGPAGYTVFDPESLTQDAYEPSVALTGLTLNNRPADYGAPASPLPRALNSLQTLTLQPGQNFLSFSFAALEYNRPEKLRYRYQLVGLDRDWIEAGTRNIATYTAIPPGVYTFRVQATNTAGVWSRHVKTLRLILLPHFWQAVWFRLLFALLLAAGVWWAFRMRLRAVQRQGRQRLAFEREAMRLEAQALQAQMNPHFIFNCLNSIKSLIQDRKDGDAVRYLTTFSKLIRSQLQNAHRVISLQEELDTCRLYVRMEALRFGDKIQCHFEVDPTLDLHTIQVPPLVLQPLLENAIWHGILPKPEGGTLTVTVARQDSAVTCAVADTGIGRAAATATQAGRVGHESKGTELLRERLRLHGPGSTITLTDRTDAHGHPTGTTAVLTLPLPS